MMAPRRLRKPAEGSRWGWTSPRSARRRIERAVQERQRRLRLDDPHAYWQRVRASEAELQELIEAVVVPETWFFRDREAFTALARCRPRGMAAARTPTACCAC